MRTTDYGKNIGQALEAVRKMHSQVSQLLVDCDGLFEGYRSVFGSYATKELTYAHNADFWMAEGVYRYWFRENLPVIGVTVIFLQTDTTVQREEPLLVVGQVNYHDFNPENPKEQCEEWDLWYSLTDWGNQPFRLGQIRELIKPDVEDRIDKIVATAVPLFSIENFADVKQLFANVGVVMKPSNGQ